MDRSEFDIIQDLMNELQSHMELSEDDLGERLGREKPKVEVMKLESEEPMEGDMMGDDMEMGPEEKLKARLMKMRG